MGSIPVFDLLEFERSKQNNMEEQGRQGFFISQEMRDEIVVMLRNAVHPHKTWQDVLNIVNAILSLPQANLVAQPPRPQDEQGTEVDR